MTLNQELGVIEKVDLREMWPNEAADFTPWLAKNITKLGSTLGLDLELQAQEAPVGSYSLDILARDLESDSLVVIENQLESTDHDHLGKLLTYAAGFDADVRVWIAKKFKDEHREALDSLNHRTNGDTQYFGIEVELWKIDNSRPAVNFNLVATPNEWRKQTVSETRAAGNMSERDKRYKVFFQSLIDILREKHQFTNERKAQPKNVNYFLAGHNLVYYGAAFARGEARVELYIDKIDDEEWSTNLFDQMQKDKDSIESELQESLEWKRMESHRACRIVVVRSGSIDDTPTVLKEIEGWMIDKLLAFKRVFGPRLTELE